MWSKGYLINIIISPNSWYEEYAQKLLVAIEGLGLNVKLLFSHEEVDHNCIAFYLGYRQIVPLKYINIAFQSLVIHSSDLPKGSGFSPHIWQILEGKHKIPLSLFIMEEGLDSGPIIAKNYYLLDGTELLPNIRLKDSEKVQEMILEYLSNDDIPTGTSQIGQRTFYEKRKKEDNELNIKKSIEEQFNLLRVADNINYPAFFRYKGKKYILSIYEENE